MDGHSARWWASPWLHAAALGGLALVVLLQYGLAESPIRGDRAYFVYLQQEVLRGESIYARTFFGYPPLAMLLGGGAMWLGGLADVPTWIAPRIAGVLAAVASALVLYVVVRRATDSAAGGAVAAITLVSVCEFGALAVTGLEPKHLIVLFSLAACHAFQRGIWWGVGLGVGLAFTCWQPAAVGGAALGVAILWSARGRLGYAIATTAAGFALGLVPSVAYLGALDAWTDFWMRAFVMPASFQVPHVGTRPGRWIEVAGLYYATDRAFFLIGAASFAGFAIGTLRGGRRAFAEAWLGRRLGGAPAVTLAWVAFNTAEFQGSADMIPILPWIAFWCGFGVCACASRIAPRWRPAVVATTLVAISFYGFRDAFAFEHDASLATQREAVRQLERIAGPSGEIAAFSAEEIYVLSERRSPLPFLRLTGVFAPFLPLVDADGCDGVRARLRERPPAVVVVSGRGQPGRRSPGLFRQSRCVNRIERDLAGGAYVRSATQLVYRKPCHRRDGPLPQTVRPWQVYRRSARS